MELYEYQSQSDADVTLAVVISNPSDLNENEEMIIEEIFENHEKIDKNENKNIKLKIFTIFINILCHLLLLIITLFIVYTSFDTYYGLFSWHPSFMMIGFFALMSEAILGFSDTNLILKLGYKNLVFCHWLLQTIAGITIVIGFVTIYAAYYVKDSPHYQTAHGIVGLIGVIFFGLSVAGGVFTKYGYQLRKFVKPVYSKIGHAICGMFTFIFGILSIITSFYTNFFQYREETSRLALTLSVICFLIGIYVLYKPIMSVILRIKSVYFNAILLK